MITYFRKLLNRKSQERQRIANALESLAKANKQIFDFIQSIDDTEEETRVSMTVIAENIGALTDEIGRFVNSQEDVLKSFARVLNLEIESRVEEGDATPPPTMTEHDKTF